MADKLKKYCLALDLKDEKEKIDAYDLHVLDLSLDPKYFPDDIDLIEKPKYQMMDSNMKKSGTMGQWMMRNTARVQIHYDITGSTDLNQLKAQVSSSSFV